MIALRTFGAVPHPLGGGSSDSATITTAYAPDPAEGTSCASR